MPLDIVRNRLSLSTFLNIFFQNFFCWISTFQKKKYIFLQTFLPFVFFFCFLQIFSSFFSSPQATPPYFGPSLIRPKEVGPTCTSLGEAADHLFHDTSYCNSYTSLNSYNWFTLSEHTHVSHYYHSYYSCLLVHSVVKVDVGNQSFLPGSSKPVLCPHQG